VRFEQLQIVFAHFVGYATWRPYRAITPKCNGEDARGAVKRLTLG
jgi:hypothetical protein